MTEARRTVGRYEIHRRLGRGGMAVVHLAHQIDLDRMVALKELSALDAEEPTNARRFLQESRLAGSLSHPSIVHVYDYFEHDGTPFIAMEYLAGGSLRPHVGHMTFPQTIGVLDAVLAALAHAEQQGIVHRDLKPENVLVAPDGHVKIADFGIAKAINRVNPSGFLTATGMAIGTPAYMAPEQAMAREVGPWTDLYAVGCMAYEFFTSTLPSVDPDAEEAAPMALLLRRINEPIPAGEDLERRRARGPLRLDRRPPRQGSRGEDTFCRGSVRRARRHRDRHGRRALATVRAPPIVRRRSRRRSVLDDDRRVSIGFREQLGSVRGDTARRRVRCVRTADPSDTPSDPRLDRARNTAARRRHPRPLHPTT